MKVCSSRQFLTAIIDSCHHKNERQVLLEISNMLLINNLLIIQLMNSLVPYGFLEIIWFQ